MSDTWCAWCHMHGCWRGDPRDSEGKRKEGTTS